MWVLYASLNPVAEGIRSLFIKRASKTIDPLVISWGNYVIPIIVFVPLLLFIDLKFNQLFWLSVFGSGIINVIAAILYMKAISESDISSVMPMLSFTPLFLLITAPIFIGEFPNLIGLVGVLFVVVGSYLLNISQRSNGIFAPFKKLLSDKGTRHMFIVAFIWSISANLDKISIQNSSIYQHIIFMNIIIFVSLTLILLSKGRLRKREIIKEKKNLFMVSLFTASAFFFHMNALSLTLVAYVVAMKRMSGVISVFLGHLFLHETNIKERLFGSFVMFVGVLLIVFS
ncbi:permease of the drug/metabolite transporter (dmt) superfamily [hydrocarbon metagenome]|uniref:Permease of the drug/metabolite transporter (Dmt) superfamily n=1 Tax=hydrocarbon metagenome TaxID=938273 RepID=A0A0W8FYG8_9ZZZZ